MIEQDWDLPDGFVSETRHDGGVIVRRYGVVVGEFPMLTPRTAIGSWAVAFEAGHTLGQKSGIEQGRTQL
ncbi:MAG: hypothetical protein KGH75_01560, partial [Rhodospirillales bacterium]|nr:hypothetical protein [Rhodospirillales bacterium]